MTQDIPFAAIGTLNAHARAAFDQRTAIYAYKKLATFLAVAQGLAQVRLIKWEGKCNRCDNGKFRHWDWPDEAYAACRHCAGTGWVTLRFTETALPQGQIWHHPWEGYSDSGRVIARAALKLSLDDDGKYRTPDGNEVHWYAAADWRPQIPGIRLVNLHLVPLLNIVEDWVEALEDITARASVHWAIRDAKRCICQVRHKGVIGAPSHSYQLNLGTAPGGCHVCGADSDLAGVKIGRYTPLLHWSLPICNAHYAARLPHPKDPPPDALITPDIRRWLDRHERIVEAA